MTIKTVRAHPEIIRRVGLGAQQCAECGAVYMDSAIPESCNNGECPTNRITTCETCGNGVVCTCKVPRIPLAPSMYCTARYHLTEAQGKAVVVVLNQYKAELGETRQIFRKNCLDATSLTLLIDNIAELAKLFE